MNSLTFKVEDIFEEILDDPDNVILKFPPEILETTGWQIGDVLNISINEGAIVIKKHD